MNFGRRPSRSRRSSVLLELVDAHAVVVHRDLHDVGLVGAEGRHGAGVRRRLGDDDVAGVDERLADQVDDLLAAGGDEHVLGVDVHALGGHHRRRCLADDAAMPSVGPYCSARAESVAAILDMQRGERLGREGRGVGQPAGERDDLGALGDGHQVAHRRGLHDRACARRRGRRSARGRARSRDRADGPWTGVRRRAARPLSSTVMPASRYRTVKLLLDILQGMGVSRRHRHPPLPADARSSAPSRPTTSASTSTAPTSPSSRARGSCWRSPSRSSSPRCCRARLETPAGEARPAGHRHRPGRAALRRHARRRPLDAGGRASIGGLLCAAHRSSRATRSLLTRTRARLDAAAAARALPLRRGRGAACSPGLAVLIPPRQPRGARLLRLAARSAGAGARARSTPAAHPARDLHQARARRHRRAQAGDARARRRHRPRPGAGRRHGARDLRRRLRRGLPVGDAGRAPRTIATGARQDAPPHPVDELVLARRAPLRRVRLVVQRLAALRARPAAHRHGLQHERSSTCRRTSPTVFESLDDAGVRTAGTTYLIYRGRHEHETSTTTRRSRVWPRPCSAAR